MGLTTDRESPCLKEIKPDGQQECYLVLSEEERAKGFVRPVRSSYKHVGKRPKYPTRPLTAEEQQRHKDEDWVAFEEYPEEVQFLKEPIPHRSLGRFWTQAELTSGCGQITSMGYALAETYARNPFFYSGTFCSTCGKHFDVGAKGEFEWLDGEKVGT